MMVKLDHIISYIYIVYYIIFLNLNNMHLALLKQDHSHRRNYAEVATAVARDAAADVDDVARA